MNTLDRIDQQMQKYPIHRRISERKTDPIVILDYKPELNQHFHELAGPWLTEELNGQLKEEDGINMEEPDADHFMKGGFYFYASYKDQIVGKVSLKRLDGQAFEFNQPYIHPNYRKFKIDRVFLERSISRCIENQASELWAQTSIRKSDTYELFRSMGFEDSKAHPEMEVQEQSKRVMLLKL